MENAISTIPQNAYPIGPATQGTKDVPESVSDRPDGARRAERSNPETGPEQTEAVDASSRPSETAESNPAGTEAQRHDSEQVAPQNSGDLIDILG